MSGLMSEAERLRRDEEDAAVVIALLASLSGAPEPVPAPRSVWGSPAFARGPLAARHENAWWASGLAR